MNARHSLIHWWLAGTVAVLAAASCSRPGVDPAAVGSTASASVSAQPRSAEAPAADPAAGSGSDAPAKPPAPPAEPILDTSPYLWHADESIKPLPAVDHLEDRIAPPAGFTRVALDAGSFGAWLRRLPLAAAGTPVVSHRGHTILGANDSRLAAVATLDIGKADLQQCADAVMRLHGEWAYAQGKRDMWYRAANGMKLPFARYARGERVVPHGPRGHSIRWEPRGRAGQDHAMFRKYLDTVFNWANTVSLAKQAAPLELAELRPGDFMVLPGNPGHTVLVLDLAEAPDGRRLVLLGQSYMPAQSFHVLRPSREIAWFTVDPDAKGIQTPFWPAPFTWSSLRRLD